MTKLKSRVKLPEKKTMLQVGTNYYVMKAYNKLIDEIGNIDIDEAFKKWAEKNGYVIPNVECEGAHTCEKCFHITTSKIIYCRKLEKAREDMELDVEKIQHIIKGCQCYSFHGVNWHYGTDEEIARGLAKAIAEAFKKGEI